MKQLKNQFCVLGEGIGYSKSPIIHENAGIFLQKKVDFMIADVKKDNFTDFMQNHARNYTGIAVTKPYKERIIPFLKGITLEAKQIGAVNTVFWKHGEMWGTNTDFFGAITALQTKADLTNKRVLVLGAGGAAKALLYGLLQEYVAEIYLWNRTLAKAEAMCVDFDDIRLRCVKTLPKTGKNFDVVINCTPVGQNEDKSNVPDGFFTKKQVVMDMVYAPMMTQMLKQAEHAGAKVVTGEKMLLFQAQKQILVWHDEKVPIMVLKKGVF